MACLTTGLSLSCATNCAGGISKFWLAATDDLTSVTIAAGEVTVITMNGLAVFYEVVPYQETGSFTEATTRANCNTQIIDTLTASFPCRSQTVRDFLEEVADCCCGLVVIHEESNGTRWIWGLTKDQTGEPKIGFPAQLISAEGVTGQAISDQNQTTITIEGKGTFQAYPLDVAVVIPV